MNAELTLYALTKVALHRKLALPRWAKVLQSKTLPLGSQGFSGLKQQLEAGKGPWSRWAGRMQEQGTTARTIGTVDAGSSRTVVGRFGPVAGQGPEEALHVGKMFTPQKGEAPFKLPPKAERPPSPLPASWASSGAQPRHRPRPRLSQAPWTA